MKLSTIVFIDQMLREEEEKRIEDVKAISKELHNEEKSSGIGEWQKGNEFIEFMRELLRDARHEAEEIQLIRKDWNSKDWC